MIVLPVLFRIKSDLTTSEDLQTELNKHSFTLVYYTDEEESSNEKVLKLYLRYKVEDTKEEVEKRSRIGSLYRAYDIEDALRAFKTKTNSSPAKIVIVAQQNEYNNKLDDDSTVQTKEYEIEYKTAE